MTTSRYKSGAILLLLSVFIITPSIATAQSDKLASLHEWIEQSYPAVDHIESTEYLETLQESDNVVVFDVREPEEFKVSHLQGAIQVDPEIGRDDFMAQFGNILKDKQVVFYCSVGRRSSLLADKVSDSLVDQGVNDIYNLKHGIFGWHDEKKPLVDANQATEFVHPFSWRWKKYLQRKELARYEIDEE